jgi:hypothetical protein
MLEHQVGAEVQEVSGWSEREYSGRRDKRLGGWEDERLCLVPEPRDGGGAPVALAADYGPVEGPVEFYGQVDVSAALEVNVVASQGVEPGGHLRVGLDITQGFEVSQGLGQAFLGHQEIQVADGSEADTGVESGGQGGTLKDDNRDMGKSSEEAGEFAVGEEVVGCGGVVGLAQVSLDIGRNLV